MPHCNIYSLERVLSWHFCTISYLKMSLELTMLYNFMLWNWVFSWQCCTISYLKIESLADIDVQFHTLKLSLELTMLYNFLLYIWESDSWADNAMQFLTLYLRVWLLSWQCFTMSCFINESLALELTMLYYFLLYIWESDSWADNALQCLTL